MVWNIPDLSLQEDAKNFTMALKAQSLFPKTFKELEAMLIERFYMLKTATDRERLAATMKMTSGEKVWCFVDRIKIATHRLATSSRLEAIKKEKDKDKKKILENEMDTLYDTTIKTTDQESEKTQKIKTEATRELWEAEMLTQCNQNFLFRSSPNSPVLCRGVKSKGVLKPDLTHPDSL